MGLARAGMAQHGTAVFAHEQTRGKGQRNKEWISAKGQNVALSTILDSRDLPTSDIYLLNMATALAVHSLLSQFITDGLKIKWPNDIYWRDRKAAGILIENIWQGAQWKFAVIGIGINVNQTEFAGNINAVSVKEITGKEVSPLRLAKDLCDHLESRYQLLLTSAENIVLEYKKNLYKINEVVRLKQDTRVFEALIKDVTRSGELVVGSGMEEKFRVGEVEWVI